VIVASGTQANIAAKNATGTIPIVMANSSDPLGKGLAANLSRPAGNITGFSSMNVELTGKRLEIFREVLPKVRRLGVLWYEPGNISYQEIQKAAEPLGFVCTSLRVSQPEDFKSAFSLSNRERFVSLFVGAGAFFAAHRK
jgi:putative ABC transport system substrate-binding protein